MKEGSIYQEVYELLSGLSIDDLNKIPKDIIEKINSKRDSDFKTRIDYINLYNPNNVSKEAFDIYMDLDYTYLMTPEERSFVDSNEQN